MLLSTIIIICVSIIVVVVYIQFAVGPGEKYPKFEDVM